MWKITEDYIENGRAVGTRSKDWTEEDARERLLVRFQMFDDDRHLYYVGVIDEDATNPLAPLDDFGAPGAGCTELHTYERGEWSRV